MDITQTEWWLIFGFAGILIELLISPGLGGIFLSLGAVTVAAIVSFIPSMEVYQYLLFCLFSCFWVIALWKPLKYPNIFSTKRSQTSDLVGQEVEVINLPLEAGIIGQVKWSGTIMNAKLAEDFKPAEVGAILKVREVEGNILICDAIDSRKQQ
ncbi:MAG: NfeD family protein [Pseudomonadota bacterium]